MSRLLHLDFTIQDKEESSLKKILAVLSILTVTIIL